MSESVLLHCESFNWFTHAQISRSDELIAVAKQLFESYHKESDFRQTVKVKTGRKVIESKYIQREDEPENNLAVEKRNHINEMTLQG